MAARQAGCAHTTVGRAAARDADFAAQLVEAESQARNDGLTAPHGAAAEAQLGRAAAWIVQHCLDGALGRSLDTVIADTVREDQQLSLLEKFLDRAISRVQEGRRNGAETTRRRVFLSGS
jgi:hypothetical protein